MPRHVTFSMTQQWRGVAKARRNSTGAVSLRRGAPAVSTRPPVECLRPPSTSDTPRPYPAPSTFHVLKIEACNVDVSNISLPQDTKHNVNAQSIRIGSLCSLAGIFINIPTFGCARSNTNVTRTPVSTLPQLKNGKRGK